MSSRNKIAAVLFTLLVAVFNLPSAFAGLSCENVDLTTQAEVNAFNCTDVTGDLYIYDADNEDPSDNIVDLSPVSSVLETVEGSLWFDSTFSLTTIDGFENLTSTGGGPYFYNNGSLASVSGFNNLVTSAENIEWYANPALTRITGFNQLQTALKIEIIENPLLTTIPMFESLITITDQVFIYDNASLPRITGFQSLDVVGDAFVVSTNPELADLCGFYNYATNHNPFDGSGSLIISDNGPGIPSPAVMQDIVDAGPCDCYTLTTSHTGSGSDPVASPANSGACPAGEYLAGELIDLTATPDNGWYVNEWTGTGDDASVSSTNQLIMSDSNSAVTVIYGEHPVCVGDVDLTTQAEVDAFDCSRVTGYLTIEDADNEDPSDDIVDLSPVSSILESTGEALYFGYMNSLTTIEGFENLTSVGFGGGLSFDSISSLVSISGFNNLQTVEDDINWLFNDSLTTVTGFRNLQTVNGGVFVIVNSVLTTIPMFDSLETLPTNIVIIDNASLPRITGFTNLDGVGFSFAVNNNAALADLCGFYNYATAHNPFDGAGSLDISDNHPSFPSPATMQDIVDAGPCDCYTLASSHTGSGSDPVASPANSLACPAGQYVAGELIDLTATPDSGWDVQGWSGTSDDGSTSNTNQLIMPASDTAVSVTYGPACYLLTSSISGSGADLFRYPSKSIGCDLNHYVEGEVIGFLSNPDIGWAVESWSGTDNDSSTANSNEVTMPASVWAVSVNYLPLSDVIFSSGFEP